MLIFFVEWQTFQSVPRHKFLFLCFSLIFSLFTTTEPKSNYISFFLVFLLISSFEIICFSAKCTLIFTTFFIATFFKRSLTTHSFYNCILKFSSTFLSSFQFQRSIRTLSPIQITASSFQITSSPFYMYALPFYIHALRFISMLFFLHLCALLEVVIFLRKFSEIQAYSNDAV